MRGGACLGCLSGLQIDLLSPSPFPGGCHPTINAPDGRIAPGALLSGLALVATIFSTVPIAGFTLFVVLLDESPGDGMGFVRACRNQSGEAYNGARDGHGT